MSNTSNYLGTTIESSLENISLDADPYPSFQYFLELCAVKINWVIYVRPDIMGIVYKPEQWNEPFMDCVVHPFGARASALHFNGFQKPTCMLCTRCSPVNQR